MRIKAILVLTAVAMLGGSCSGGSEKPHERKIMSYNIRNCIGMDGITDYQRAADVILSHDPDVVALQELDSATMRADGADVLDILADLTGMHPVYGPAIDFDGGKYGVGVLSKDQPVSFRNLPLPGREERRTLLIVEFDDHYLLNTHLSLAEIHRMKSLDIIGRVVETLKKPVILAGDLNDTPGSKLIGTMEKYFVIVSDTTTGTFPAGEPVECIDYVMFYGSPDQVEILSNGVDTETLASDHCPIGASIRF